MFTDLIMAVHCNTQVGIALYSLAMFERVCHYCFASNSNCSNSISKRSLISFLADLNVSEKKLKRNTLPCNNVTQNFKLHLQQQQ